MALEFNKLADQVLKLRRMLEEMPFETSDRLQIALQRFRAADDLDYIHERIELARSPEVSGYRGAAPLDAPYHEVICQTFPPPPLPPSATLIAADGSQVYPNEQAPFHYFLINTGLFVYHHGGDAAPEATTHPRLIFHPDHVHDASGRLISARTVDAQRTVFEMRELADLAWERRGEARPLVALYDNHLLFRVNKDVTGHTRLFQDYQAALVKLHDAGALLAGYVDSPVRSRVVMRLLHLLALPEAAVRGSDLGGAGDLEGLRDLQLFNLVLKPGERSALMVQNSPHNFQFRQRGVSYEIAFFYLKVSSGYQDEIARVDIPMWVARDRRAVDELHALVLEQCRMQGRNPYPYALTRADELAYVSSRDKQKLDEIVRLELRRRGIDPRGLPAKARGKELARSPKRQYET